jgi:alkyl hydroperoxide reductase subunit F
MYDLAIIGGGPAGVAAGIYASRKRLKTILLTYAVDSQQNFGGQSVVSTDIQNWIGTVSVSGEKLAKMLEEHLRACAADIIDIYTDQKVVNIEKNESGAFTIKTERGESYESRTILVASGSTRRKLAVPGADKFEHKGITYCASCDGPLFTGKDTVVIGGGNAGFETAAQLLAYVKSVTLLDAAEAFKADPVTVRKVLANPKMKGINNAKILEIKGEKFVTGLVYEDTATGKTHELQADGIFVEIGMIPATSFAEKIVELNKYKQIVVDPRTQRTSVTGIWAAGDCTDGLYHQNNIAVGDAVKALEDIYIYLRAK